MKRAIAYSLPLFTLAFSCSRDASRPPVSQQEHEGSNTAEEEEPANVNAQAIDKLPNVTDTNRCLLGNGADVNAKDKYGDTIFHWAVRLGKYETIKAFLNNGVNVNGRDRYGITALYWAVILGEYEIVKILLYNGADMHAENSNYGKDTALNVALRKGRKSIIYLLRSADVRIKMMAFEEINSVKGPYCYSNLPAEITCHISEYML